MPAERLRTVSAPASSNPRRRVGARRTRRRCTTARRHRRSTRSRTRHRGAPAVDTRRADRQRPSSHCSVHRARTRASPTHRGRGRPSRRSECSRYPRGSCRWPRRWCLRGRSHTSPPSRASTPPMLDRRGRRRGCGRRCTLVAV